MRVRTWIWKAYLRGMEVLLPVACLGAAVVLLLRFQATAEGTDAGWGRFLLPSVMFGGYGFARLAVLTVFDASLFPGGVDRYIFPATLSLTIAAAWLIAESLRLLGGAFRGRERALVGQLTNRKGILLGSLFAVGSLTLFLQWGYGRYTPPDFHYEMGQLEQADGEVIRGWARLKERPEEPVQVEIDVDGVVLATVLAEEFRRDLVEQHIGTGSHGFSYSTPRALADGKEHVIRAKIAGTSYELRGSRMGIALSNPIDGVAQEAVSRNAGSRTAPRTALIQPRR
jgi:hypothetical protein